MVVLRPHLALTVTDVERSIPFSRILDGNDASLAVHRAAGFEIVGVQRRHGQIDGEWRDCMLVEHLIGSAAA